LKGSNFAFKLRAAARLSGGQAQDLVFKALDSPFKRLQTPLECVYFRLGWHGGMLRACTCQQE